jgi:3-oxoacyl-[acyl-carrier protein] reductase
MNPRRIQLAAVRSVLITGASRGIGLGMAERLAGRGWGLTIAGRDGARLSHVVELLRARGAADVIGMPGDILNDDYLTSLVTAHREHFTTMDAVIINAGSGSSGKLANFHLKRFDKQIATNLRSAFVLVQLCLPALRAAANSGGLYGAKVIAMASLTGLQAEPELAAYGAAKAGLIALCRSLNAEENCNGITATAIAPGYVDTDMAEYKREVLPPQDMIAVSDVVELVDACLRLTRRSVVAEIAIARSGTTAGSA